MLSVVSGMARLGVSENRLTEPKSDVTELGIIEINVGTNADRPYCRDAIC